jgi:hypothetical protein
MASPSPAAIKHYNETVKPDAFSDVLARLITGRLVYIQSNNIPGYGISQECGRF